MQRVVARSAHEIPERLPIRLEVGERIEVGECDQEWPAFVFVRTPRGSGWVPERHLDRDGTVAVTLRARSRQHPSRGGGGSGSRNGHPLHRPALLPGLGAGFGPTPPPRTRRGGATRTRVPPRYARAVPGRASGRSPSVVRLPGRRWSSCGTRFRPRARRRSSPRVAVAAGRHGGSCTRHRCAAAPP